MALPTLAKTWNFSVNHSDTTGTAFTGYGALMYAWKTALTTLGANPWTVVSSSDGISNAGAADYWTDPTKCKTHNSSGNRSWIVLQQTSLAGGTFQFCLEHRKTGGGQSTIFSCYISEGGLFTGGSLTARPTATDEVEVGNVVTSQQWTNAADCTVNPCRLHVMVSDDGESTRWWIYNAGYCCNFAIIDKPNNAPTAWANPWVCLCVADQYSGTSWAPTFSYLNDQNVHSTWRYNSARQWFYCTCEGCVSSMLGEQQTWVNDIDGGWPFYPIGLFCTTAGARGRQGTLYDLWWGSTTRADGDHYPADTSRQFAQVGDLIVPWLGDGTIMLTA